MIEVDKTTSLGRLWLDQAFGRKDFLSKPDNTSEALRALLGINEESYSNKLSFFKEISCLIQEDIIYEDQPCKIMKKIGECQNVLA